MTQDMEEKIISMDAIHYHVRSEGRIVKRAVYIALGIDMNGKKDVPGMYVGENESAKFWLSIMNGLKNRGVEDIKKLMSDLKRVYAAPTEESALNELELFRDKWDAKYPKICKSWHENRLCPLTTIHKSYVNFLGLHKT